MRYKILPILLTLVLALSCTGKRGPTGPQGAPGIGQTGPQGPIGPPGPGRFIIYTGIVDATSSVSAVIIPELGAENFAGVLVYVWDADLDAFQLLTGYDKENGTARWFEFDVGEGSGWVIFANCQSLGYLVLVMMG